MSEKKTLAIECWRSIPGNEGLYQISMKGEVRSLNYNRTGKIQTLKPQKNKNGYLYVALCKNGKKKLCLVHRLVGMTFLDLVDWTEDAMGKPFSELDINHKKEGLKEKANNHVECLEWCDRKYNINYGTHDERSAKARSKRVAQKTKGGELVKIWPSTMEIQRQTGWSNSNISACCRGERKSAHGFLWEFVQ